MKKRFLLGILIPISIWSQPYIINNSQLSVSETDIFMKGPGTDRLGIYVRNYVGSDGTNMRYPVLCPRMDGMGDLGTTSRYFNTVYAQNFTERSDERIKKDIRDIDPDALAKIQRIQPVSYLTRDVGNDNGSNREIGFLAQDLERAYPELVNYDAEGDVYSVRYSRAVVVLVAALKEQQKIMARQANELDDLSKKVRQ